MSRSPSNQPSATATYGTVRGLAGLMRPLQWVKNAFVFAPLLFSGEFLYADAVWRTAQAALLFCLGASAAYIVNDWYDIERDRRHPVKRLRRPLAAGTVGKPLAAGLLALLYALLAAAWFAMPGVVLVIAAYLLINLAYTLGLKHVPVLDIFVIASGFVLRVYAGALALAVPVSQWMFVTTLCLALYLAAIKRRQELAHGGADTRQVLERYSLPLIERYAEMSAIGALVFYGIFVVDARPELVVTIPLVLFGLFRYWYVVQVLGRGESPADALFSDAQLVGTIVVWVAACAWALWPH